ncbi:MAG TPA: VanZ family protein [Candidatus Acidoferrales bacterium]|jgi:VanZ family protein|nr:VanZ family protein [Candidatus Acidoferrales bacterium]
MRAFLTAWAPVLIWMIVIFGASADSHSYEHSSRIVIPLLRWLFPHMPMWEMEHIHHFLRKCCHVIEYSIFGFLIFRAVNYSRNPLPAWSWPRVGGALLLVFIYAATDEYHQRFVPTRTPRVLDVCIDAAGGALGIGVAWLFHYHRRRKP